MVSHPVGTTVFTTDLFRHLPVRKQIALKSAAGCLARIKKLLQAYALARPNVRLSLKTLKAKTDKGTFTYAPKSSGTGMIEDAAFKVIGRACASQCVWTTFDANGLELQAFLPRADADPAKISSLGSFISVDSRPVSANRGTLKQIASKFRDAIRKSHPNFEGVKDPFLLLNIVCPPGSYDPNVEPAKDDVLFDDSEMVIMAVEKLLTSFYSVLEGPDELLFDANDTLDKVDKKLGSLSHPHNSTASSLTSQNFGQIIEVDDTRVVENGELAFPEQHRATQGWGTNMYECDDDDVELMVDKQVDPSKEQQEAAEILRNVNLSNPWTIARMAARREANAGTVETMSERQYGKGTSVSGPVHGTRPGTHRQRRLASPTLPEDDITERYLPTTGSSKESNIVHAAELISLQSYPRQLPTPLSSSSPVCSDPPDATPETTKRQKRQRAQGNTQIPYANPIRPNPERNWFQFGPSPYSQRPRVVKEGRSRDIRDFVVSNPKVGKIQLVVHGETADHTGQETSAPFGALNSRPGDHQFLKATDVTLCTQVEPENVHNAVPQEDDNMIPKRSHKTGLHRMEFSLLPLERIPEEAKIQDVLITLRLNPADISSYMSMLCKDSNHPKLLTLPDSQSSGFLPLPKEEELKHWCNRMRTYLHPVLNAENEFEDFQEQIDEAFTRF